MNVQVVAFDVAKRRFLSIYVVRQPPYLIGQITDIISYTNFDFFLIAEYDIWHSVDIVQSVHSPGKPGKVKEFEIELLKNRELAYKDRENATKFPKSKKSGGFCCVKFTCSQLEDPNCENFLGDHAPPPPPRQWPRAHSRVI